jgi:hypothetical protein
MNALTWSPSDRLIEPITSPSERVGGNRFAGGREFRAVDQAKPARLAGFERKTNPRAAGKPEAGWAIDGRKRFGRAHRAQEIIGPAVKLDFERNGFPAHSFLIGKSAARAARP